MIDYSNRTFYKIANKVLIFSMALVLISCSSTKTGQDWSYLYYGDKCDAEVIKDMQSIKLSEAELIGQYYNNLSPFNEQEKLELKKDSSFTFIRLIVNAPHFNSVLVEGNFTFSENQLQLNIENVYNYSFEDTVLTEKKVLLGNLRKKEYLYRNDYEKYLFRNTTGADLFNDKILIKCIGSLILLVPSKLDKDNIQAFIYETDKEKQLKVYCPLLKKRAILSDDFMNPEVPLCKIILE